MDFKTNLGILNKSVPSGVYTYTVSLEFQGSHYIVRPCLEKHKQSIYFKVYKNALYDISIKYTYIY